MPEGSSLTSGLAPSPFSNTGVSRERIEEATRAPGLTGLYLFSDLIEHAPSTPSSSGFARKRALFTGEGYWAEASLQADAGAAIFPFLPWEQPADQRAGKWMVDGKGSLPLL